MWIEPSRKFDSVLNILFKVVKFRSLERLERKREKNPVWLNNISTGININTYKMVLSVVINFVEIVSKSKCQQKYLGMSQNEEL